MSLAVAIPHPQFKQIYDTGLPFLFLFRQRLPLEKILGLLIKALVDKLLHRDVESLAVADD